MLLIGDMNGNGGDAVNGMVGKGLCQRGFLHNLGYSIFPIQIHKE